jgi:hypothetical protein
VSFEVCLQSCDLSKPSWVSRKVLRDLFPVVDAESDLNWWQVRYDDVEQCDICVSPLQSDPSRVRSLTVFRPCGDMRLWEAILEIMRIGPMVLYFPGDAPLLVTSTAAGELLPVEMVEAKGQLRVVSSAQEILEIIRNA